MRARQQHRQPVLAAEREVDLGELRRRRGAHVGVEVGDVEPGRERRLDLRPALGLDRAPLRRGGAAPARPATCSRRRRSGPRLFAVVEIGRQRQARDSLVSVRWTPRSSSGCSLASSTISANQGQGTITEPVVTKPWPASSTKARLAPWPTADVVDVRDQHARAGGIAEHGGKVGHDRLLSASSLRRPP